MGGAFELLENHITIIRELVSKLPQGPGEGSGSTSSIARHEYDAHMDIHKKQQGQLSHLEKAYADLAKSHGELSRSHAKMRKREKRRDKFFTKLWKGMKGIWKTIKGKDPIPSSKVEEPDDVPVVWSDDEEADDVDSEATESEAE